MIAVSQRPHDIVAERLPWGTITAPVSRYFSAGTTHIPGERVFLDEAQLKAGTSVNGKTVPFEIGRLGNVYVDRRRGQ